MIPWLLVAELVSTSGKTLSELIGERQKLYPASGEINRKVEDAAQTLQTLHDKYAGEALDVDGDRRLVGSGLVAEDLQHPIDRNC